MFCSFRSYWDWSVLFGVFLSSDNQTLNILWKIIRYFLFDFNLILGVSDLSQVGVGVDSQWFEEPLELFVKESLKVRRHEGLVAANLARLDLAGRSPALDSQNGIYEGPAKWRHHTHRERDKCKYVCLMKISLKFMLIVRLCWI